MLKGDFGLVFWLHLILIIGIYLSPFLFNYKLVILLGLFLYAQEFAIGGCFLTKYQLKKGDTFYHHYLTKLGFKLNKYKLNFFITWILPIILLIIALIFQKILNFKPLIF